MKLTLLLLFLPILVFGQRTQTKVNFHTDKEDKFLYRVVMDTTGKPQSFKIDPEDQAIILERKSKTKSYMMNVTFVEAGATQPPVVIPPPQAPSTITVEAESNTSMSPGQNRNAGGFVVTLPNGWIGFNEIDFGVVDHKVISFKFATADNPPAQVRLHFDSPTSLPVATYILTPITGNWGVYKQTAEFLLPPGINGKKLMYLSFSRGFHLDSVLIK